MRMARAADLVLYLITNPNTVSSAYRNVSVRYAHIPTAAEALRVMNGAILGSKQIVVRLHEPKQLRQEKLAQRFGHNGHPRRTSSGATSPAASEAGDYSAWNSPRAYSQPLASPALSPKPFDRPERGRRGSGSYYTVRVTFFFIATLDPDGPIRLLSMVL